VTRTPTARTGTGQGRYSNRGCGHRVGLLQKHCERSSKRITRWPPYTSTPRPSAGLSYTTLLDSTRPDPGPGDVRLGQPEDFGSADRRTSQVAGYCERTAIDSSTVDNLSIRMTANSIVTVHGRQRSQWRGQAGQRQAASRGPGYRLVSGRFGICLRAESGQRSAASRNTAASGWSSPRLT